MNIGRRESISKAFIDNNVDSFGVLVKKNIVGFNKRLQASDNVLACSCISINFHLYGSKMNAKWNFLIFYGLPSLKMKSLILSYC